ncbi:hypothetical protein C8Q79DRAFT_393020 [Trametes meyenii]|nr:hypothetical protein C8Q79DRAFT_393020 [Trametes meyenii]
MRSFGPCLLRRKPSMGKHGGSWIRRDGQVQGTSADELPPASSSRVACQCGCATAPTQGRSFDVNPNSN